MRNLEEGESELVELQDHAPPTPVLLLAPRKVSVLVLVWGGSLRHSLGCWTGTKGKAEVDLLLIWLWLMLMAF